MITRLQLMNNNNNRTCKPASLYLWNYHPNSYPSSVAVWLLNSRLHTKLTTTLRAISSHSHHSPRGFLARIKATTDAAMPPSHGAKTIMCRNKTCNRQDYGQGTSGTHSFSRQTCVWRNVEQRFRLKPPCTNLRLLTSMNCRRQGTKRRHRKVSYQRRAYRVLWISF